MIFAPATEAANYPRYRTGRLVSSLHTSKVENPNWK